MRGNRNPVNKNKPGTSYPLDAALNALGIHHFYLGIQDAAFPSLPEEDIGRGSPYSEGAAQFARFARTLGFNGIQLGPQGITTPANPSPYDGTFFSKNFLSLAPLPLSREPWGIYDFDRLTSIIHQQPPAANRVCEDFARKCIKNILTDLCSWYQQKGDRTKNKLYRQIQHSFTQFRQSNATWLERDGLYEVLRQNYGARHWKQWGEGEQAWLDKHLYARPVNSDAAAMTRIKELRHLHAKAIEEFQFGQFLLAEQHKHFRGHCRSLGIKLYGDCQIGFSGRDAWYAQSFLLRDYVMGAPPSRTNPSGQPWNFPVLDPRHYHLVDKEGRPRPGPALHFLQERITKLLNEFDGLRIDHPHGLVCPWVYRAGQHAPLKAVQEGARLFASPHLADHPALAEFAIVRPEQIDTQVGRYDDRWVISLEPGQVRRYAVLIDLIMAAARQSYGNSCEIACEILSTQPYPIKQVMELYGLGRFRVTQKADLDNRRDIYRSENARPEDWVMLGNHDTPSIWQIADQWVQSEASGRQAAYLAERLQIPDKERTAWIAQVTNDAGELAQAKFADLFCGPAQNIMVFFTDLLGIDKSYNQPGTISGDNWTLRIEPQYQQRYLALLNRNRALNIPKALAMALRAKRNILNPGYLGVIQELESFHLR